MIVPSVSQSGCYSLAQPRVEIDLRAPEVVSVNQVVTA